MIGREGGDSWDGKVAKRQGTRSSAEMVIVLVRWALVRWAGRRAHRRMLREAFVDERVDAWASEELRCRAGVK